MTNGKIILGIVASVVVVGGVIVIMAMTKDDDRTTSDGNSDKEKEKDKEKDNKQDDKPTGGSGTTTNIKLPSDDFPLKVGSKGKLVLDVQMALRSAGQNVKPDGSFGTETRNALRAVSATKILGDNFCGFWGYECEVTKSNYDVMMKRIGINLSKLRDKYKLEYEKYT